MMVRTRCMTAKRIYMDTKVGVWCAILEALLLTCDVLRVTCDV